MCLWSLLGLISGWSFRAKPRNLKVTLVSQSGLDDLIELNNEDTGPFFFLYIDFIFYACMYMYYVHGCNHGV